MVRSRIRPEAALFSTRPDASEPRRRRLQRRADCGRSGSLDPYCGPAHCCQRAAGRPMTVGVSGPSPPHGDAGRGRSRRTRRSARQRTRPSGEAPARLVTSPERARARPRSGQVDPGPESRLATPPQTASRSHRSTPPRRMPPGQPLTRRPAPPRNAVGTAEPPRTAGLLHHPVEPRRTGQGQGYCVLVVLVTALMRSCGRRLARLVARAMLGSPLLRW